MTLPPKPPIQIPEAHRSRDPLRDEALAWIAYLHSGNETANDWASFESWRRWDAARGKAAEDAEKLWETLGPALTPPKPPRKPIIPGLVLAALCLAGIAFASGVFGPPASFFADYRTSVGEVKTITLGDGSRVDLDTATSFDVDAEQRSIVLHTGQIFVEVKPDPVHPFSVKAGDLTVRALGTAFVVRRDEGAATVVVTEHTVSVSRQSESIRVTAGQSLTYSPQAGFQQLRTVNIDERTAWRRKELIFGGQPLSELVKEVERYHRGKILILDDTIRRLPVSGVFDVTDADTLFESIELALPVSVTRLPGITILRRDPARALSSR